MKKLLIGAGTATLAAAVLVSPVSANALGGQFGYHGGMDQAVGAQVQAGDLDQVRLYDQTQDMDQDRDRLMIHAQDGSGLTEEQIAERDALRAERQAECDGTGGDAHRYGRQ